MKLCIDCGADISYRGCKAKRCVSCQKRREAMLRRQYVEQDIGLFSREPAPECVGCDFVSTYGWCNYAEMMGQTRLGLHKGESVDINSPCKERRVTACAVD